MEDFGQHRQVLLFGNATHIEELQPIANLEAFPKKPRITFCRMEPLNIDPPREEPYLLGAEAFLDQFLGGAAGRNVNVIHLFIVPEGKLPDEILHAGITRQVLRVLGERRVIGPADWPLEDTRNGQSR